MLNLQATKVLTKQEITKDSKTKKYTNLWCKP